MEIFSQVSAVFGVLALLGASLWWLRRRGFAAMLPARLSGPRRLEGLERLALGPQQTLHLVRFGRRALLVSSTPAGCTLIDSVPFSEIESLQGAPR